MGQLIIKFRDNNPKKAEMQFKLSLPAEIEKVLKPKEVIVNGIVFEKKETSRRRPKNRND